MSDKIERYQKLSALLHQWLQDGGDEDSAAWEAMQAELPQTKRDSRIRELEARLAACVGALQALVADQDERDKLYGMRTDHTHRNRLFGEARSVLASPDLAPWVALLKEIPLTMRGHAEKLGAPCHCLLCDAARRCRLGYNGELEDARNDSRGEILGEG